LKEKRVLFWANKIERKKISEKKRREEDPQRLLTGWVFSRHAAEEV
jgi:hypothetical protein